MNFNNAWRKYLSTPKKGRLKILSEQKRKNFLLILEGRKQDAKKRYPITAQFEVVDVLATQLRAQFGERGVSRYIMFAAKCMEEFYETHTTKEEGKYRLRPGVRATTFFEQVMGLVVEFHTAAQRLEEKDINKYTYDTLYQILEELPESPGERKRRLQDKAAAYRNSELVYNENGIFGIRPLTTQSACYFGENPRLTTWCISTKSARNYFEEYTQKEGKAFVIVKFSGIPEDNKNHIVALEFDHDGDLVMFWDAPNESQNPDDLDTLILSHLSGMEEDVGQDEDFEELAARIERDIREYSKKAIVENPPPSPLEASEIRCHDAERLADQTYEFVNVSWDMESGEPGEPPKVLFYATLNIAWDVDKVEYENESDPKVNFILDKDYDFWRTFEDKFSDNLRKMGRPWSDMAGLVNCYTEDGYVKLEVRFDGYDSYHPETAEGFESFTIEDCRAIENRGEQMQELLGKMLEMEAQCARDPSLCSLEISGLGAAGYDNSNPPWVKENKFYKSLEKQILGEEKGRSRQRGIYKFYCMISYNLTADGEKSRGLDDILADLRALENVTIVTVAIRNQKIAEGRYIAGLAIKFIPSTPGDINTPENVKARVVRDIKRLDNVQSLFKLSTGLIRLE